MLSIKLFNFLYNIDQIPINITNSVYDYYKNKKEIELTENLISSSEYKYISNNLLGRICDINDKEITQFNNLNNINLLRSRELVVFKHKEKFRFALMPDESRGNWRYPSTSLIRIKITRYFDQEIRKNLIYKISLKDQYAIIKQAQKDEERENTIRKIGQCSKHIRFDIKIITTAKRWTA